MTGLSAEGSAGSGAGTEIEPPHAGQVDPVSADSSGAFMRWEQWGHSNLGI